MVPVDVGVVAVAPVLEMGVCWVDTLRVERGFG